MQQLPLFTDTSQRAQARVPLDDASEILLNRFRALRIEEGAHPRTVAREVSQLRALAREAGLMTIPLPIASLLTNLPAVVHALCEPRLPIARTTGRARLIAAQRFITTLGPLLGYDAGATLQRLDALLPLRRGNNWHDAGTLVAGTGERRRNRGPTLFAGDLQRIVIAAGRDRDMFHAARDRALVALQCFSGLRAEELMTLCWEHVHNVVMSGTRGLVATVERNYQSLPLPILGPAQEALLAYVAVLRANGGTRAGAVFRRSLHHRQALSYRAGRNVMTRACRNAGLPPVESAELRAACAYWLQTEGFSDHEIATILGMARVRSVDRLLRHHHALVAQRVVRERNH